MGVCAWCGKQTAWWRRVRSERREYCDEACHVARKKLDQAEFRAEHRAELERAAEGRKAYAQKAETAEQKAAAAKRRRLAPLKAELSKRILDPFAHIEYGDRTMALKAPVEAKGAYFDAISLGIPNLRESAMTRWKWVKAAPEPMESGERLYQTREADKELRRHIRSNPDDVEALKTLILIVQELGNDPAELNSQLARAKARRKLKGGTAARGTALVFRLKAAASDW